MALFAASYAFPFRSNSSDSWSLAFFFSIRFYWISSPLLIMKMLSVQVEDAFAKEIDAIIAESGQYSSRSEFMKDAIRKNMEKMRESAAYRKKVREAFRRLAQKARDRGWDGQMPTQEERDKIAEEFVRKNNIKLV
jgi:Arc/MetJ-type ribon-helix-helix transcriptional regulator